MLKFKSNKKETNKEHAALSAKLISPAAYTLDKY